MKLLSQQIRDLVNDSPSSSYAIAREAGIDKSTMSRFMNGGRLTMDKLDQLAKVLGVEVNSKVSLVPRSLEKGRPTSSKAKRKEQKMDKAIAQHWADYYAQDAHDNYFSSHRGIWHLEELDCLLIYNNHPYSVPSIRKRELKRIERRLKAAGIKTLAYGEGGGLTEGGDEPYTISMLLECSKDRLHEVRTVAEQETQKGKEELDAIFCGRKK